MSISREAEYIANTHTIENIDAPIGDALDAGVRSKLGLQEYRQFLESQALADTIRKPTILVIGLGPGARTIIDHYTEKGYSVHALDSQIDVGGRLRNVAPTKAHYQRGLTELFHSVSHPNVHTITGIHVGLTEQEKGDIQLNDLVKLGGYNAVFLAVGTKETQAILQNGNNLGWEQGHEYGYGFTERAYRWVREGNAIGDLPFTLLESGKQIVINGVGYVGIEDTARLVQAIQLDRALRRIGIIIPSEELIENPKKALANLQKQESSSGELFRNLIGMEVDFNKDTTDELRRALQEKLCIKPVIAIYRGSQEKLYEKVKPNALKVFMDSAFFTIEYNREIGAVQQQDNVRLLQLVERRGDGTVLEQEKIPYSYVISAIGGSRPDVQFGESKENVKAGTMQVIDGVVIGYAGNATESKGNKKASENDAKARIEEADALLGNPEVPDEDTWKKQVNFIRNIETAIHLRRGSGGNSVKDTLLQIPIHTLNEWEWVQHSNGNFTQESRPQIQGNVHLMKNLDSIITLLPFIENGILRSDDVTLVPLFDDTWENIVGYEVYFSQTDSQNRVIGVRSLGLRITDRGLERQYASAFPWSLVHSEEEVRIALYSRSQIQFRAELPENFSQEIERVNQTDYLTPDQWVLAHARDRIVHLFPWINEGTIPGVTLLPIYERMDGSVSHIEVLYNGQPMGLRITDEGLLGFDRGNRGWREMTVPTDIQHIVSDMTQDALVPTNEMVNTEHMQALSNLRRELALERATHERMTNPDDIQLRNVPAHITDRLRRAIHVELEASNPGIRVEDIIIRPIHNGRGVQHIEVFARGNGHTDRSIRLSPSGEILRGWGMLENTQRFQDAVTDITRGVSEHIAMGGQQLARGLTTQHRSALETISNNIQVRLDGSVYVLETSEYSRITSDHQLRRFARNHRIMQGIATQQDIRIDRREEGFIDGAIYITAALAGTMVSAGLRNIGVYEHVMTAVCSSAGALVPVGMAAIQPAMRDWERLQTRGSNENKRRKALRRLTGAGTAFLAGLFGESLFHSVLGSDHQIEKTPQAIKPKDPVDQPKSTESILVEKPTGTIYSHPTTTPEQNYVLTPSQPVLNWTENPSNEQLKTFFNQLYANSTTDSLPDWKQNLLQGWASELLNHNGWRSPTDIELWFFKQIANAQTYDDYMTAVRPSLLAYERSIWYTEAMQH